MSAPYFAPGYLRVLYQYARSEGVPAKHLLVDTGFTEADLMSTEFEAAFAEQMRFCENAVANTSPGLGLRAGRQLQLAAHGTLGTAMQSSESLQTSIRTFCRFLPSRASFYDVSYDEPESGIFRASVRELPTTLEPFFTETLLLTLFYCVTFFSGRPPASVSVSLSYPDPGYADAYRQAFGENLHFDNDRTEVRLPRELLHLPSPEFDPETYADSVRRCTEQIGRRSADADIIETIETFLLDNPGRLWKLDEIAPLLAMSPRTAIRRLKTNDTTYQALRDSVLMQQAETHLRTMTVEGTAMALGFSDTSSFRRTYRRWHGRPPGAGNR